MSEDIVTHVHGPEPRHSIQTSLLGRLVTIDYPNLWKYAEPRQQEECKRVAMRRENFGKMGEIVAVYQDREGSLMFCIRLVDNGQLTHLYSCAFTLKRSLEDMKKEWLDQHQHLNNAEAITCFVMFLASHYGMHLGAQAQEFIHYNHLGELRSGWANQCEYPPRS